MPDYSLERSFAPARICGVDEAGRGPWAGPVVASAVMFVREADIPTGLNDSKKLKAATRDQLHDAIREVAMVGVGVASVEEIDQLNIWGATSLAMRRAMEQLHTPPEFALIDGKLVPKIFPCAARAVVKGDSLSLSIAAASIIAKVTRDRMMSELHARFPHYGFARHMGYGTAIHQRALAEHGPCDAHRRSFAPIRALLQAQAA